MDCTRRAFVSGSGLALAGAFSKDAWARPAAWTGGSATPEAQQEKHEEHPNTPMSTHASANEENQLAAAEEIWAKLLEGNQRFASGKPLVRDVVARRNAVLSGQHPQVVVLTCSDSRITPCIIFDQGLGDLVEVRTAGNVADALALGSIEYALIHLTVRTLVVLGHEQCGAVKAAASGEKMPTPNLQALVDRIAPAIGKVQGDPKSQEFLRKAEEANVLQCASDLLVNSPIVLRETAANNVEIIKAVYSLKTGQVRRLQG